ncbi:MAG: aprE [Proteobacteria bacterium]|nr:aprE [Pseudomonadota bacterium]
MATPDISRSVPVDTRFDTRMIILVIILVFGFLFAWGFIAQLNAGAIAMGEVVPTGRVRIIQHLEGGIIRAINVRDGDRVKAGDELLVLDDTEIRAALKIAERELTGIRARLVDVTHEIESWRGRNRSLRQLADNAEREGKINKELYEKNYISLPRLLQLESQKTQAEVTIGENLAELSRAMQKKSELEAMEQATLERITVAKQRLDRIRILAPQDGIINNLKFATIGGVIAPGGGILELVPNTEELIVEAKISPDDIDVVYPGLKCQIKLTAYKARSHMTLEGKVLTVSGSTFKEESSPGRPYYKARIEISAEELAKVEKGLLTPGMLTQVYIVSGSRSAMRYLLDPIIDSFGRAFKES